MRLWKFLSSTPETSDLRRISDFKKQNALLYFVRVPQCLLSLMSLATEKVSITCKFRYDEVHQSNEPVSGLQAV
jgi:hypothetical protein